MKINEISKLKEKEHIVLLPKHDYDIKKSTEYSFKNVISLEEELSEDDIKQIIDTVNEKNVQLILFDYDEIYRKIIPYIRKNRKIKWVMKNSMAAMTDGAVRATFSNLMEFCDRNLISCIGCIDSGAYEVLKNAGYNTKRILLDIKEEKASSKKSNSIGLLGDDYNPNHNTYNQLTAITMVDYDYIKIIKHMPATRDFIKFFNIKEKEVSNEDEVIKDNFINLYCNFTSTVTEKILMSMDNGIPCLLGNIDIFDNYKVLKENLILISDDDVNEIAKKIMTVKNNSSKIMDEYKKFRKDYTKLSKESIESFLAD